MGGPKKKGASSSGTKSNSADAQKAKPASSSNNALSASTADRRAKAKKAEAQTTNGPGQAGQAGPAGDEVVKKPTVKAIIGGASWTGKLPVNLLAEHCQKQGWHKPEYSMHKSPDGFLSAVTLSAVHPKTKEPLTYPPMEVPREHREMAARPTALEARHFAATYALFRVSSHRNIQFMLPPDYRDLWRVIFQEWKTADAQGGKSWLYDANPFAAKEAQAAAAAAAAKQRDEAQRQKAAAAASSSTDLPYRGAKPWTNVPTLEMGKRIRAQVEDLVRKQTVWNVSDVQLSTTVQMAVVEELSKLGFRKTHAQEAASICKDREETLEWLLIHVPEDDLPRWALPEDYAAGLSLGASDLRREATISRLALAGYGRELCSEVLDCTGGAETRAAELLQQSLFCNDALPPSSSTATALGESEKMWSEEVETLLSVYGPELELVSATTLSLRLKCANDQKYAVRLRMSKDYPSTIPVVAIEDKRLPAYIKMRVYQRFAEHAAASWVGEPMLFNTIDWLETNLPVIAADPGKLSELSQRSKPSSEDTPRVDKINSSRKQLPPRQRKPDKAKSAAILEQWQEKSDLPEQRKMQESRKALPAWQLRIAIVESVRQHRVCIISGETGSGKSTQAVQFILDDMIQQGEGNMANILCTQPRRISALGLADRVSAERCTVVGHEIGYSIRGESKVRPGETQITFMTTGVLLRRLQTAGGSIADLIASLADVSHVVIDEVHERSLDTDFLLILLRDVLQERKDLKLVLMSATLDATIFEDYFAQVNIGVGRIEIQGRTHPVEDFYLDDIVQMTKFKPRASRDAGDSTKLSSTIQQLGMRINYELIATLVAAIDDELNYRAGGILIFLPGVLEINRTLEALRAMSSFHVLPLHASLTAAEQRKVFASPPKGKRKVIAATNVAETSITIDDIVAVIDSGRVKENSLDPQNQMVRLQEVWASRAACKQRRGRAGRVTAGECYKLYTRNAESKMAERPEPEMRRVPLEQLCLAIRAIGITDIAAFLSRALTPPDIRAVDSAITLLGQIGAFDGEQLTALGRHLSLIPADLRCGKLMVFAALFGCFDAGLIIAAILTARSPFLSPQEKRDESKAIRTAFGDANGDLIADLRAVQEWRERRQSQPPREVRIWCDQNLLSHQTLNDIMSNHAQYLSSLIDTGFVPATSTSLDLGPALDAHGSDYVLIRSLIAGALHPHTARIAFPEQKFAASSSGAVAIDPEARTIRYFSADGSRVFVHPSSTLFDAPGYSGGTVFLSYFAQVVTTKVFIRELTPFHAYALLLLCGSVAVDTHGRGLTVDGWLRLKGWARIGVLVSRLRAMLDQILAAKMEDPSRDVSDDPVVVASRQLIEFNGLDR